MVYFFHAVRGCLRLLGPDRRWRWALLVVLALVVTGFESVGAVLVYTLIDIVSGDSSQLDLPVVGNVASYFSALPQRTVQVWAAVLVAAFFVLRALVVIGQSYAQARLVHNAGARLATRLVNGYLAMPYLTHTQTNSAELVRNAFDSVQSLETKVMKPAVEVVAEFVLVIGLCVVLAAVSPDATIMALLVLGPAMILLQMVVQPALKRLGRASQGARRHALQAMQQALGGVRDIRLLGREREFVESFAKQREVMSRTVYVKSTLAALPRLTIETGLVLVIVAIFVPAVLRGEGLDTAASTLAVLAYGGLRLKPSLRKIVEDLNHIRFGAAIIEDLDADRRRVEAVLEARRARNARQAPGGGFRRSIELRNVTFAYAPDGAPVLRDIDLTIRKGESVGICGPTGSGKSTLVDLVVGLLQPTIGQVLVDGRALDEHPAWWYAELGVVSQSVYLIDDTLRRNIAFGLPDEEIDEARLQRSIERAQLTAVIDTLPDGLDTIVGERGVRLSGGQRQRVAVARALYREPSVIIFDEGTSALDAATEAALGAALDELKAGRTLISVAHRISTVRHADRILVVHDGRITSEGTYDDLMRGSELFRALAR